MNETPTTQGDTTPELIQDSPSDHPAAKHKSWLKRLLMAILLPIMLFAFAGLMVNIMGPDTLQNIEQGLNQFWAYATAFRLLLIAGISFIIVPSIIKRTCAEKYSHIQQLERHSDEESQAQIQTLHKQIAGLQQIKSWIIALVLIIMDICLLQIPFLIK